MAIDERLIERWIRAPGRLLPDERRRVEALVEASPAAAALAEELRAFYDDFDALGDAVPVQVDAFVDALFPQVNVVSLHPYRPPTRKSVGEEDQTPVLAAATSSQHVYERLATLTSPDGDALVRLLAEQGTERCRLYVVTDRPERRAHVLVSLPDVPVYLPADENGRLTFTLGVEQQALPWRSVRGALHWPLVSRPLALPARGAVTEQVVEKTRWHVGRRGTAVEVRAEVTAGAAPRYAVVDSGAVRHVLELGDADAGLELDASCDELTVRLYE